MAKNELPQGLLQSIRSREGQGAGPLNVRIDLIEPDPNQPRKHIDPRQLDELATTIRKRGVLQPITIRRSSQPGRWVIETGERRWRAAQLAGQTTIPAFEAPARDRDARLSAQVIENQHRAALSNTDIARFIEAKVESGTDFSDIAQECNIGQQQVKHYRALLKLPDTLKPWADRLDARTVYELYLAWQKATGWGRGVIEARLAAIDQEATLSLTEARRVIKSIQIKSAPDEEGPPPAEKCDNDVPTVRASNDAHVIGVPDLDVIAYHKWRPKQEETPELPLIERLTRALECAAELLESADLERASELRRLAQEVRAHASHFAD